MVINFILRNFTISDDRIYVPIFHVDQNKN